MKLEHKVALSTLLVLLLMLGAGAISTAIRRVEPAAAPSAERALVVPVQGVGVDTLVDSWGAPRGSERVHQGIDIAAPAGTPVRAAMAGTIAKLFRGKRGGVASYQLDPSGHWVFYYAHLKAYAAGLRAGDKVAQGQIIATVGATGNATTPHLHFEIQRANRRRQWWRGTAFNPYGALKAGQLEQTLARRF